MKNIIYTFIFIVTLITCREPSAKNKIYPTSEDKKIVRENCYSCHDPIRESISIPQVEMVEKLGLEGFKSYLYDNFKHRKNCVVIEHCQIKLTVKEIESVYLFIKESKKYVH